MNPSQTRVVKQSSSVLIESTSLTLGSKWVAVGRFKTVRVHKETYMYYEIDIHSIHTYDGTIWWLATAHGHRWGLDQPDTWYEIFETRAEAARFAYAVKKD